MSTTVSYKGSTIATVENNTKTLKTAGKYLEGDVVLTDVSGAGSAHTATIIKSGIRDTNTPMYCFVKYGSTNYYTKGDTFTFNAGDTIKITIQTWSSGTRIVMENGVILDSATTGYYTYNYTLPDYDIEIMLEQQWMTERGVVNISKVNEAYQFIASNNYTVNTTSTSSTTVGTFQTGDTSIWTSDKMVYIKIRDNNGPRAGYFYGCDCFLYNFAPHYGSTATQTYTLCGNMYQTNSSGRVISPVAIDRTNSTSTSLGYGVYPTRIYSNGDIDINARFSSSSPPTGTINGNFSVDVYLLEWASGIPPFNG